MKVRKCLHQYQKSNECVLRNEYKRQHLARTPFKWSIMFLFSFDSASFGDSLEERGSYHLVFLERLLQRRACQCPLYTALSRLSDLEHLKWVGLGWTASTHHLTFSSCKEVQIELLLPSWLLQHSQHLQSSMLALEMAFVIQTGTFKVMPAKGWPENKSLIFFVFAIFRQHKGVWVGKSRIAPIDPKLIENPYYIK